MFGVAVGAAAAAEVSRVNRGEESADHEEDFLNDRWGKNLRCA
jgi:hypothetical protein